MARWRIASVPRPIGQVLKPNTRGKRAQTQRLDDGWVTNGLPSQVRTTSHCRWIDPVSTYGSSGRRRQPEPRPCRPAGRAICWHRSKLRETLDVATAALDLVGWDPEHDWQITLRTEDHRAQLARLVTRRRQESVEVVEEADVSHEQAIVDACDELLSVVGAV